MNGIKHNDILCVTGIIAAISLLCFVSSSFSMAGELSGETVFLADSTVVAGEDTLRVAEIRENEYTMFPDYMNVPESALDLMNKRWDVIMGSFAMDVASPVIPRVRVPATVYGSDFSMWGRYSMIPFAGNSYFVLNGLSSDVPGIFMSDLDYAGMGIGLGGNLSANAGAVAGYSSGAYMNQLMAGGRLSLICSPNRNTSFMLWGQYMNVNIMPGPSVPGGFTGSGPGMRRIETGTQANFKVGDVTIGIGASVSDSVR